MLIMVLLLFCIAALLGIYLLIYVFQNKNTPKGIAFIHGPIAIVVLIILIIYAFHEKQIPLTSIILFILSAFLGIILIYRDITGKTIPNWLAVIHGLSAVFGFVFLIPYL